MAAGFATERWTLKRIAALIEREFGVHYHPRYLERPLKAHGFSVQRPATRAKERDELVIAVWPKRDWVALKKRRSGSSGTLLLWDETGHSFRARPGTTWARRGLTPVLRRVSKRREVSSIVAITPDGRLYARHFRTSVSSHRDLGPALLPPQDRHAAAGGLGSAQRPPVTGDNRLHRCACAGLCGGLPAGLCARSSIRRSSAMPSSSAPWRTRCPDQSTTCIGSPVASSAVSSVNPR